MSDDERVDHAFDDAMQKELFLSLVAQGVAEPNAAFEVDWSPFKLRKILKDPEFRDLIRDARDRCDGDVQKAVHTAALKGNVSAQSLWLFNRQPALWRDVKRIEIRQDTTISIGAVNSYKEAALQLLREQGVGAIQALGPGSTIIEVEARDDDVVDG